MEPNPRIIARRGTQSGRIAWCDPPRPRSHRRLVQRAQSIWMPFVALNRALVQKGALSRYQTW